MMYPNAKNEVAAKSPIPKLATVILSRLTCISGETSNSSGLSFAPVFIKAPLPLNLPTIILVKIPAKTIEVAFPMATAGFIIEIASSAVIVPDDSKILLKGTAPAPIPPPIIGRAINKIAFTIPNPVTCPANAASPNETAIAPKIAGK